MKGMEPARSIKQSRLSRGAALARLALRIGGRYAARSPRLIFASVDRRRNIRHDLAFRSAEDVAEELLILLADATKRVHRLVLLLR